MSEVPLYRGTSLITCGYFVNGRVHLLKMKNVHEKRFEGTFKN